MKKNRKTIAVNLEASKDFLEHLRARSDILEGQKNLGIFGFSRFKFIPRGPKISRFFVLYYFHLFFVPYFFPYFFNREDKKSRGNISTIEDTSHSNKLPRGLESSRRIYNLEEKLRNPREFISSRLTTIRKTQK